MKKGKKTNKYHVSKTSDEQCTLDIIRAHHNEEIVYKYGEEKERQKTLSVLNSRIKSFGHSNIKKKEADFSHAPVEFSSAKHLVEALLTNKFLTTIKLVDCNISLNKGCDIITDKPITTILQKLLEPLINGRNTTLTALDLSQNSLGDDGAKIIADLIIKNPFIINLGIGKNNIADEGFSLVSIAIGQNSTLRELNVENNYITNIGALSTLKALKINCNLRVLKLKGNPIEDNTIMIEINDELVSNKFLSNIVHEQKNTFIPSVGEKILRKLSTIMDNIKQHIVTEDSSSSMTTYTPAENINDQSEPAIVVYNDAPHYQSLEIDDTSEATAISTLGRYEFFRNLSEENM